MRELKGWRRVSVIRMGRAYTRKTTLASFRVQLRMSCQIATEKLCTYIMNANYKQK